MQNLFLGQVSLKRPWERGPSLGASKLGQSKMTCCVVKGPGGNQVQRCHNDDCGLNWVSAEGIYPGVPACAADGRPVSCQAQQPVQVTNVHNGETSFTVAQQPTGSPAGDPFQAVAPRTPISTVPYGSQAQSQPVQVQQQAAPQPAPAIEEPCPEGAQPIDRWAYACAMAHRR